MSGAPVGTARGARRAGAGASPLAQVEQAVELLRRVLSEARPESMPREAAHELARATGVLEKLAAAATVCYARAAGKEAALLLASASGTAAGTARRRLDVARRASVCRPLADAFGRGDLSVDQTAVLAPLAAIDPSAVGTLLATAPTLSVRELRAEAERLVHQRRGEREAVRSERLMHARRYCRIWVEPGGSVRLDARVGSRDGAALRSALQQEQERLWRRSRPGGSTPAPGDGSVPTADQLRADALVALVTGKASGQGLGRPELLVRVDAAALLRGEVGDGEVCEIAGLGPVSVRSARSLLGEALWTLLVTSGTDVRTVSGTTRVIPKKLQNALLMRDRGCVVPGCGVTDGVEIDHWARDFAWDGATALWNLALLCRIHHEMKTRTGWRLSGGPGKWRWLPPKSIDELSEDRARRLRRRPSPTDTEPGRSGGDNRAGGRFPHQSDDP
jgi:hypothetical protein